MLFRQRHRSVEANNRELARDMQDGLDHTLAHLGAEIIKLGSVVPGHAGAVVAMVNIALLAGPAIDALEYYRRIAAIVIMIFEIDSDSLIPRKIGPVEAIRGVRAMWHREKPVGMLDHPAAV